MRTQRMAPHPRTCMSRHVCVHVACTDDVDEERLEGMDATGPGDGVGSGGGVTEVGVHQGRPQALPQTWRHRDAAAPDAMSSVWMQQLLLRPSTSAFLPCVHHGAVCALPCTFSPGGAQV